jgi:hypothetical protein
VKLPSRAAAGLLAGMLLAGCAEKPPALVAQAPPPPEPAPAPAPAPVPKPTQAPPVGAPIDRRLYGFFSRQVFEQPSYGLYTYVLLGDADDKRAQSFLTALVTSMSPATPRGRDAAAALTDLYYIPVRNDRLADAWSAETRAREKGGSHAATFADVGKALSADYDPFLARDIYGAICSGTLSACAGRGPFLMTFSIPLPRVDGKPDARTLRGMEVAITRFSDVSEEGFRDELACVMAVGVNRDSNNQVMERYLKSAKTCAGGKAFFKIAAALGLY